MKTDLGINSNLSRNSRSLQREVREMLNDEVTDINSLKRPGISELATSERCRLDNQSFISRGEFSDYHNLQIQSGRVSYALVYLADSAPNGSLNDLKDALVESMENQHAYRID